MKKKQGAEKMLSVLEVAEKLNKTPSSIRIWAAQGRFPGAQRIEPEHGVPYWLIPQSDVDSFEVRGVGRPAKAKVTPGASKRKRKG